MAGRGGHIMTQSGNIIRFGRGVANDDAESSLRQGSSETWRRLSKALGQAGLRELDCVLDTHNETIWVYQQHATSLGYSRELLHDVRKFQSTLVSVYADPAVEQERPFDFIVWGSRRQGVFNLGG